MSLLLRSLNLALFRFPKHLSSLFFSFFFLLFPKLSFFFLLLLFKIGNYFVNSENLLWALRELTVSPSLPSASGCLSFLIFDISAPFQKFFCFNLQLAGFFHRSSPFLVQEPHNSLLFPCHPLLIFNQICPILGPKPV